MTYPSPNHPPFEITQLGRIEQEGRETRRVVLGTHTGTHFDAPRHFISGGAGIDSLPLEILVGPATVVPLIPAPELWVVSPEELARAIPGGKPRERVLLRFDWSTRFGDPTFYSKAPALSLEACQWLLDEGVKLIGMDVPSPDAPRFDTTSPDSPCHKLLLGQGVILVEYLRGLDRLQRSEVFLAALPLPFEGADGAPGRVVAWYDE
mgnify:CR=1 FL=1